MEFGRTEHIENVDFSMPPDDPITDELFAGLSPADPAPVRLHIGCAIWGRKDWAGKIYPKNAKEKDFLSYYVRQFNTIELNTLFYSLQPKEVIGRWAGLAGEGFRYCPKFSNTISHLRQLKDAQAETDLFIEHMRYFGASLGPSFLQLSDRFAPTGAGLLNEYVGRLPRDFPVVVELRHEDWFTVRDTWKVFREQGIGTVITDTSGRRDLVHMRLTAPVAFIRFVGNSGHPTDYARVDAWVDRIKCWIGKGLREIYFFVHNHEERNSPELCSYAIGEFNKKCGLDLKPPKFEDEEPQEQLSLF
ncbi:MAG TPA: DUF72 domain-containing protein [Puia sp.]|nr:DUF72 domain-containing protein [Puia sp.]